MAINWMDNFNIYGTDAGNTARMLNGVYAEVGGFAGLAVDPDPTVVGQFCLALQGNANSIVRKVLPTARTTLGALFRLWLSSLPDATDGTHVLVAFRDVNNVQHGFLTVDASGNLTYFRNDTGGVTVALDQTDTPVLVANAWKHIETKIVLDNAAGSIEVRVEGVTVLEASGIRTTTNAVGAVASCMNVVMQNTDFLGPVQYYKDFIIWDSTTGFNNNFMGSCQVMKIIPDGDVALNWTPSSGTTGYNLINEVTPDDDVNYISAPFPAPAAYVCSLSDLPVTVTSVRGVMPIHRSRKIDGGDGNIQIGVISGASTGLGADRPMTTAYTYWFDVFDTDPATAAAWSRVSVNAMNLQINRTL